MSDHDRGPYTPPNDRLAFDPREPVRSGGPAPVTLIVSGVVLLAIIAGVFLVYRGGVRHKGVGPVAVGAPLAQIKTPVAGDAGAPPAALSIDKVEPSAAAGNAAPAFAPPPEAPLPRPLPEKAQPVVATSLPPAAASIAPAPPAPPPAKPPVVAKPAPKPITIASLTDAALSPKPAVKPATPKAVPAPPPPPAEISPPPTVVATAAAAPPAGQGWVQIGAYSSSALAEKGWSDVAKLAPSGMTGKGRKVEPVSKDGKTLYRAYVTGFASKDAAQAFCGKLKAAGRACFVK